MWTSIGLSQGNIRKRVSAAKNSLEVVDFLENTKKKEYSMDAEREGTNNPANLSTELDIIAPEIHSDEYQNTDGIMRKKKTLLIKRTKHNSQSKNATPGMSKLIIDIISK